MSIIVYHGSVQIVKTPEYGRGKPHNDYGSGFYMTEDPMVAKEWAVGFQKDGFLNQYELDTDGLQILDLNKEPYTALHWLEILISNRIFAYKTPIAKEAADYLHTHFHVSTEAADLIKGYRADDSYFQFANDFLNNTISYPQLTRALVLGKLGEQVMLKSPRAFSQIRFLSCERVAASEWYSRKIERDQKARSDYYNLDKQRYEKGALYMTRIIDEEVRADDERLR